MNEIIKHEPSAFDRIADPIEAIEKMGAWFAKSGMFGCEKVEQGNILAMAALCERKSPIVIADTYHLMDGKLAMKSRAQLAKFRQSGGRVKWLETTDTTCRAEWTFEGDTSVIGFTFAEAERMGIVKPNGAWFKQPAEMLRARATSRAVTMLCPEILIGGGVEDDNRSAPSEPAPNPLTFTTSIGFDDQGTEFAGDVTIVTKNVSDPLDGPAPKVKAEPEPVKPKTKSEAAEVIDATEITDRVTVVQLSQVLEIVEECHAAAAKWMVEREWIPSAADVEKISSVNAQLVIDKPEKFQRAIAKFAAEN